MSKIKSMIIACDPDPADGYAERYSVQQVRLTARPSVCEGLTDVTFTTGHEYRDLVSS
jgi:hypothetical protein